jgi:hypothetical protein
MSTRTRVQNADEPAAALDAHHAEHGVHRTFGLQQVLPQHGHHEVGDDVRQEVHGAQQTSTAELVLHGERRKDAQRGRHRRRQDGERDADPQRVQQAGRLQRLDVVVEADERCAEELAQRELVQLDEADPQREEERDDDDEEDRQPTGDHEPQRSVLTDAALRPAAWRGAGWRHGGRCVDLGAHVGSLSPRRSDGRGRAGRSRWPRRGARGSAPRRRCRSGGPPGTA